MEGNSDSARTVLETASPEFFNGTFSAQSDIKERTCILLFGNFFVIDNTLLSNSVHLSFPLLLALK
jgi:hypothetical protein